MHPVGPVVQPPLGCGAVPPRSSYLVLECGGALSFGADHALAVVVEFGVDRCDALERDGALCHLGFSSIQSSLHTNS